jgi:hypothetical protein
MIGQHLLTIATDRERLTCGKLPRSLRSLGSAHVARTTRASERARSASGGAVRENSYPHTGETRGPGIAYRPEKIMSNFYRRTW